MKLYFVLVIDVIYNIFYKYIVFKVDRNEKEELYVWDYLLGGVYKN